MPVRQPPARTPRSTATTPGKAVTVTAPPFLSPPARAPGPAKAPAPAPLPKARKVARAAAPAARAPKAVRAPKEKPAPATGGRPDAAPATAVAPPPRARSLRLKPKYFLAMAGNIGAGKTTAAKLISQRLGFELFDEPVIDNRFLRDYYASMGRWSFTLQLEFLIRRVEHHELIHTVGKSCVQDRTLYEDPEIFAKYLHGLGHMDNRELDLYFEYFQRLNRNLSRPDKIICFDVPDIQVLLKRIQERGRAEERGIPPDFLRGLNAYYSTFPQVVQQKYGIPCLTIDVSTLDIRARPTRDEFLDRVTDFLRE